MNNKSMDDVLPTLYSTYGLVTVERVFATMNIHLSQDDLQRVSDHPEGPYFHLLQVPLKNIFNGIIINQATDFREYAQKMLVDYLISGAANVSEEQPRLEGVRFDLECMRTALIETGERFDVLQFDHHKLINDSQRVLIDLAKKLPKSTSLDTLQDDTFVTAIAPFRAQAELMTTRIKEFRAEFYKTILKVRELLGTVTNYFNTLDTEMEHIEALYFDAQLGDET